MDPIAEYWEQIKVRWHILHKQLLQGNARVLNFMQTLLPEECSCLGLEISYGKVNGVHLDKFTQNIELYVSPRMKRENIPIMEQFIAAYHKSPLPNLMVLKYRMPHTKSIKLIEFTDFKVNYTDFGCFSTEGLSENKPLLNLVILVNKDIAKKILSEKLVQFNNGGSSRMVYMSTCNALDLFLLNIIGEYNLLNHVGYIECLPSDHSLIVDTVHFTELSSIKNDLLTIIKRHNYTYCNLCNRPSWQTKIYKCSRCIHTKYCSKLCQLAAWPSHKAVCKPVAKNNDNR